MNNGFYRYPRGKCRECGEVRMIRRDGMVMRHSWGGRRYPCPGSLCAPSSVEKPA